MIKYHKIFPVRCRLINFAFEYLIERSISTYDSESDLHQRRKPVAGRPSFPPRAFQNSSAIGGRKKKRSSTPFSGAFAHTHAR